MDLVKDIKQICQIALRTKKTGAIILGAGVVKHHILNANIWKNGLDFSVFINDSTDQDASDSGA